MNNTDSFGPILRCERLSRIYDDGATQALRGVSLSLSRGESVAITGPSGCGKSTLLHLLGGLDRPTEGEIYFEGKPLASLDLDLYRARRIGFVFQAFHLLPTLTALENVQIPMFESPLPRDRRAARASKLLEEVGLAGMRDRLPAKLSIGERQRVAIARSLANEPSLLLADEPTGNLDSQAQTQVLDLLNKIRLDRRLTLAIVTHSAEVAKAADRVIRLRDGRTVED